MGSRIQIVPLRECMTHEGVVDRWVDAIAANLLDQGLMKNPIVVTKPDRKRRRIVIDGMHRFAALRKLEIRDVVVYEVDYADDAIRLAGWDALTFRPFRATEFIRTLALPKNWTVKTVRDAASAQQAVDDRRALVAIGDRRGKFALVVPRRRATVAQCVSTSRRIDSHLDAEGYRPLYVADTISLKDFTQRNATGIIIRAHYTKDEIVTRITAGRIFPRKSTRHVIPGRPLRVDIGIPLLRADISLRAKNRLLEEHLRWCYESDRIRYYPESVFIYAD
jgi:L-serine kinase (ADP)